MKIKYGIKYFETERHIGFSVMIMPKKGVAYAINLNKNGDPIITDKEYFEKNMTFNLAIYWIMFWIKFELKGE